MTTKVGAQATGPSKTEGFKPKYTKESFSRLEQFGVYVPTITNLVEELQRTYTEIEKLNAELETERMRLAGCGVAALGYAEGQNDIGPDSPYYSASFGDAKRLYANYVSQIEQNKTLRKALEFYADETNYTENESGDGYHNMDVDNGALAREALEVK